MTDIKLVCLDFDGTIMCYDEPEGHLHPEVIAMLDRLSERGIAWCTNSGRNAEDQSGILKRSVVHGLKHLPRALLCCESLIFEKSDGRYIPSEPWNSWVRVQMRDVQQTVQTMLKGELDAVVVRHAAKVYVSDEALAFYVTDADGRADRFHADVKKLVTRIQNASLTRNGGWVAILPSATGKGNLLRKYASLSGYRPEEVLAIGDHWNDISMLDGSSVRHVGCPADAMPEVLETVRKAGGIVASAKGPSGTVEIIEHHLE